MTSRRSFLSGLLYVAAAPAVVRAASLMPVRLFQPEFTPAQEAWIKAEADKMLARRMVPAGSGYFHFLPDIQDLAA